MADVPDNSQQIQANALKPQKGTSDGVTIEMPSLKEQIAADQYARAARQTNKLGVRFVKVCAGRAGL